MTNTIKIAPYFVSSEEDLETEIEWIKRDAVIKNVDGKSIFEQRDVEFPRFWSDTAVSITADKYFKGIGGTAEREHSLKQLAARVVNTITEHGLTEGYFDEESAYSFSLDLKWLIFHQYYSFNSPVYFNVGIDETPQVSACFIQSVEDDMDSILQLAVNEGRIFKNGSGTGTNFSRLRGRDERLSGGGLASGPVSFMKGLDASAGVIKSGGKTRRAAKMVILDVSHPDVRYFIRSKLVEEEKARALKMAGYSDSFDDENGAYSSVAFQNENHSVRVNAAFMRAVEEDGDWDLYYLKNGSHKESVKAREILREMAEAIHYCGDPGILYSDNINKYNTIPNSGEIRASNPCLHGDTLIQTSKGLIPIRDLADKEFEIVSSTGDCYQRAKGIYSGRKSTVKVTLSNGLELIVTSDHRLASDGDISKKGVIGEEFCGVFHSAAGMQGATVRLSLNNIIFTGKDIGLTENEAVLLGYGLGDGTPNRKQVLWNGGSTIHPARIYLRTDGDDDEVGELFKKTFRDCHDIIDDKHSISSRLYGSLWDAHSIGGRTYERSISQCILEAGSYVVASFLRGLFSANGSVLEKYNKVQLKTSSKLLAQQVVQCLAMLGIRSNIGTNRATSVEFDNGVYECRESYNVTVSNAYLKRFASHIGFVQSSKTEKLHNCVDGDSASKLYNKTYVKAVEPYGEHHVYDFAVLDADNGTEHCGGAGGIVVHNCGEYLDIDDSACNLGSFNLIRFVSHVNGKWVFDHETFRKAVRIATIAQEILVGMAKYPTEKIAANALDHRQLGCGFANLGALLMYCGYPYDSSEGRTLAGCVASMLTGTVYSTSAEIARVKGPFAKYEDNKQSLLSVIGLHKASAETLGDNLVRHNKRIEQFDLLKRVCAAVWRKATILGKKYGYRNSKASVLAPTGTIGFFMDCDTTGAEPELSLIKTKSMVGGGAITIVNNSVLNALENLGYKDEDREAIAEHIDKYGTVDGCEQLNSKHVSIFDCAFGSGGADARTIAPMGHVKMLEAIQPHISGGISKTINLPESTTADEIDRLLINAWKMGVKAMTIYRDRSKVSQPLQTVKQQVVVPAVEIGKKRKLPSERDAKTHGFTIAGHKFFLVTGLYPDGSVGEIFITASKSGSTLRGLFDCLGISVSLGLQHGVPLTSYIEKFAHVRFEPSGFTDNQNIKLVKSIPDYIFRYLAMRYVKDFDVGEGAVGGALVADTMENEEPADAMASDAPPCLRCGSIMVRSGTCFKCAGCGDTSGCS